VEESPEVKRVKKKEKICSMRGSGRSEKHYVNVGHKKEKKEKRKEKSTDGQKVTKKKGGKEIVNTRREIRETVKERKGDEALDKNEENRQGNNGGQSKNDRGE